jgi:alginate O-acetyltransferase complex protein AlgJ
MGLLARFRRFWIVLVLGLLAVPAAVELTQPRAMKSEREARNLAAPPSLPQTLAQWRALPRAVDTFLGDHFGLREPLVRAYSLLRYALVSPPDSRVVYGRDKFLFFNGDAMLQQSMGIFLRRDEIEKFAEHAAALQARLRNAQFLVTAAPNSATIMRAQWPAWAPDAPDVSEYDLMMQALAARGIPTLDLRPPLRAANAQRPVYRNTDTHWNRLGALLAYDAVVAALHRSDWNIDPAQAYQGFESVPGGDLARMLGVSADVDGIDARIDLSLYAPAPLKTTLIESGNERERPGNLTMRGRAGPTVVVIGDSFTEHFWTDYFALHAGRYVWFHHEQCGLDPARIEAQHPDIVILAPTERLMFCWNG